MIGVVYVGESSAKEKRSTGVLSTGELLMLCEGLALSGHGSCWQGAVRAARILLLVVSYVESGCS